MRPAQRVAYPGHWSGISKRRSPSGRTNAPRFSGADRAVLAVCIIHQKHCHSRNAAEHGRSRQRRAEILRWDDIGQLRAARQAGHSEGAGPCKQDRRDQMSGKIRFLEHGVQDRAHCKHHDKQAHSAIGQDRNDDDGGKNHPLFPNQPSSL